MTVSEHLRVASLQYDMRPVSRFEEFRNQVAALVMAAADSRSRIVVFPEYFTTQLFTLGDASRPPAVQVRALAAEEERFIGLMADLAEQSDVYIVAGTIPGFEGGGDRIYNKCHVFGPGGRHGVQLKLQMTRFEDEEWLVSRGRALRVFEAPFGKFAVAVCYDAEFPEIARAAAQRGAQVLFVPSYTETRHGFYRVRYCAQARAIESQMFVVHSSLVGAAQFPDTLPQYYGQSAILTPCDQGFPEGGVLAQGKPNAAEMVTGDLDLKLIERVRTEGTVLTLHDSARTAELVGAVEEVAL